MLRFITKRLFYGMLVLWGVVTVVFLLFNVLPGNPARMILGERASQQAIDVVNKDLGLNRSLFVQYVMYVNDLSPISIHNHQEKNSCIYLGENKYSYVTRKTRGEDGEAGLRYAAWSSRAVHGDADGRDMAEGFFHVLQCRGSAAGGGAPDRFRAEAVYGARGKFTVETVTCRGVKIPPLVEAGEEPGGFVPEREQGGAVLLEHGVKMLLAAHYAGASCTEELIEVRRERWHCRKDQALLEGEFIGTVVYEAGNSHRRSRPRTS